LIVNEKNVPGGGGNGGDNNNGVGEAQVIIIDVITGHRVVGIAN